MPNVEFVAFNDVGALRSAFSKEVCAVALETIQGEGGIHPVSHEFLAAARELCSTTGALLLIDEIQSGMGRTGTWCAYQQYGIQPDVTTLAKPLAGGIPIGAMLCTEAAASSFTPGMHGTTFGGNPLACAVAIAVIDEIKNSELLEHVTSSGSYFLSELMKLKVKHTSVIDVRGRGLMIGVELDSPTLAKEILQGMLDRRIILNRTHETVLRFLPPFLIKQEHIDLTIKALDELLELHERSISLQRTVMAGEPING